MRKKRYSCINYIKITIISYKELMVRLDPNLELKLKEKEEFIIKAKDFSAKVSFIKSYNFTITHNNTMIG